MPDIVRLHVSAARELVRGYRYASNRVHHTRGALAATLADAVGHVPATSSARDVALARLDALAALLERGADDLEWRVDYVEALGASGGEVAMPRRPSGLRPLPELLALVGGRDADVARVLEELVFHAITEPASAAAIVGHLDAATVRTLLEWVVSDLQAEVGVLRPGMGRFHHDPEGRIQAVAALGVRADQMLDPLGVLLSTLSHHPEGRQALLTAWDYDTRGEGIHLIPLALRAGVWDADFLLSIAEDVFSDRELSGLGAGLPLVHFRTALAVWPELLDPSSVVLGALGRNPAAAREWLEHHDGFWRIVSDDSLPYAYAFGAGHIQHGHDRDEALASVLAAAADGAPAGWLEQALRGTEYRPDHERVNDGILYGVEVHLPGEASALPLADVIVAEWDHLVVDHPGDTVPVTGAGPAFAVIMESDEGLARLLAGYGMHLEHIFAETYRPDSSGQIDPAAIDEAMRASWNGFHLLSKGLENRDVGGDDHALARGAFALFLGEGAKALIKRAPVPAGLPMAALGFVAGEVVDAVTDRVLPVQPPPDESSQSILEDLFLGGRAGPGAMVGQPAPGEIMLANALLAGDPSGLGAIDPSPYVEGGTISVPTDAAEMDAFATWFHAAFYDDVDRRELVYGTAEDLSVLAARVAKD